jgi:hypothetical protein
LAKTEIESYFLKAGYRAMKNRLPKRDLALISAVLESVGKDFSEICRLGQIDPELDFRYADLSGVDFGKMDLARADFTGANLDNADLSQAQGLSYSALSDATLNGTKLPTDIRGERTKRPTQPQAMSGAFLSERVFAISLLSERSEYVAGASQAQQGQGGVDSTEVYSAFEQLGLIYTRKGIFLSAKNDPAIPDFVVLNGEDEGRFPAEDESKAIHSVHFAFTMKRVSCATAAIDSMIFSAKFVSWKTSLKLAPSDLWRDIKFSRNSSWAKTEMEMYSIFNQSMRNALATESRIL